MLNGKLTFRRFWTIRINTLEQYALLPPQAHWQLHISFWDTCFWVLESLKKYTGTWSVICLTWRWGYLDSSNTVLMKMGLHKNTHNDNSWVHWNEKQIQANSVLEILWRTFTTIYGVKCFFIPWLQHPWEKRKTYLGPTTKTIKMKRLWSLGVFSDLFFIWMLSDLPLAKTFLPKL